MLSYFSREFSREVLAFLYLFTNLRKPSTKALLVFATEVLSEKALAAVRLKKRREILGRSRLKALTVKLSVLTLPFVALQKTKTSKVKVVGKRSASRGGLEVTNVLLKLVLKLRGSKVFFPKGVYRFKSYEEKERWEHQMRAR